MNQVFDWVWVLFVAFVQVVLIYCLWDDTMVKFFGVPDVTFMDSFWISCITSLLFKNTVTLK